MSQYGNEANPADVEEQEIPVAGGEPQGEEPEPTPPADYREADEGDVLEQSTPVSVDDEDYPNELEVEPDV